MELQTMQSIASTHETTQEFMTNQLAVTSQRIYKSHIKYFDNWLADHGLTFTTASDLDLTAYRVHLLASHAKKSASTMLTVVKQLYLTAYEREVIKRNPAKLIKGIKADTETTPYRTLTVQEAKTILDDIDTSKLRGLRDYMIIAILIRTGIRRAEIASLMTSSLSTQLGKTIITYTGKGQKRQDTVLPDTVAKKLNDYMKRANLTRDKDAALFYSLTTNKGENLSGNQINMIVHRHSNAVGLDLSPHALRATFITVTLGNGARLDVVQRAVHHANARTTQHYETHKDNITNHAGNFFPEI